MRAVAVVSALLFWCASSCSTPNVPQKELPPPLPAPPKWVDNRAAQQTDEAATEQFLDQQIERLERAPPVKPPLPPRTVYVDVPQYGYVQPTARGQELIFPWSTAIGAGVGAIIGNQYGDSGEGAAIGASVGFLNDLVRWNR